jgi:tetratricopeptide (TPR) repeat protein
VRHELHAILLAGGAIALAAVAAYHNSFSGAFLFDDLPAIVDNPTIRHFWPIRHVLSPPVAGAGVAGRPILNLSFAVNYAFGGTKVWGYHALNLFFHVLGGLTLFGIVRRTLLGLRGRYSELALPLALLSALLWTVHPLGTESVTAVVQRSESLMGLFYLLTLYCFIRGTASEAPWHWYALSLTACFLGMATKEVMVSAPLMVFLYDRTFVAQSFSRAWRERWRLYLGLAGTWLVLAALVLGNDQRHGTVGFDLGVTWWGYALTQCRAVLRYLGLSLWPHPLVFDYGTEVVTSPAEVVPALLLVTLLVVATGIALVRRPALGFLGAWFFSILAPSSSILPLTTQTMAEHRMYLPLAAVVVLAVLGAERLGGRRAIPALVLLVGIAGWRTVHRNRDYRDPYSMWSETVARQPRNARAHSDLATALAELGRDSEATVEYEEALRLKPDFATAYYGLGNLSLRAGLVEEAGELYERAVRLTPDYVRAWHGLGDARLRQGRVAEAITAYQKALAVTPDSPSTSYNLAHALFVADRTEEARAEYQRYLTLKPDDAEAHGVLGVMLAQAGQAEEALRHLAMAARLDPTSALLHFNHAGALLVSNRLPEATREYEEAVRLKPDYAEAHFNLANVLARAGRMGEATAEYEQVLRLRPDHAESHHNLATVLFRMGRREEAKTHYQRALALSPNDTVARRNLEWMETH